MLNVLNKINEPKDLKSLSEDELNKLAEEIREILLQKASVYGMNDVTHLGIYDIALISNIPNMVYLAPTSKEEYFAMLDWSIEQNEHPVAIRIPCNGVISDKRKIDKNYSKLNKYKVEKEGNKIAILALGDFLSIRRRNTKRNIWEIKYKSNFN